MVATTVFEVTMVPIVNAAYLQADKPRDSTVQGLIDKRIAGAYVEPAVYRELHYVGGWIVNRVTEHFGFKLDTVPKQDGPLPLVSDTNAWAYRLCAWCDTSTGRIMPDSEDLAPTQRRVRIQPVVRQVPPTAGAPSAGQVFDSSSAPRTRQRPHERNSAVSS